MENIALHEGRREREPTTHFVTSSYQSPRPSSPKPRARAYPRPCPNEFFPTSPDPPARKLWSPDTDLSHSPISTANKAKKLHRVRHDQNSKRPREEPWCPAEKCPENLTRQPPDKPFSQEELVAEVKEFYAGLVMVEAKCIEVDAAKSTLNDSQLNQEQWQALIALHRTLLHDHHDFHLVSQHPSAGAALRRPASIHALPARMWRHGIHAFIKLLRQRLPGSLERMLFFIYLAYSTMALVYETPAFKDTWIECLGDLGRNRMAMEDENLRDREVWTTVSRHCDSKAAEKSPTTGRLYHHLGILARPNALRELFYYTKSLCAPVPFTSARDSITTLIDPNLNQRTPYVDRIAITGSAFEKALGMLSDGRTAADLLLNTANYTDGLDRHISRSIRSWMHPGYYIAIADCHALVHHGVDVSNLVRMAGSSRHASSDGDGDNSNFGPGGVFQGALQLIGQAYQAQCRRFVDLNVLPFFHATLVFLYHLDKCVEILSLLERQFPWRSASLLLNAWLPSRNEEALSQSDDGLERQGPPRPLPEDFAMRGLLWSDKYFPKIGFQARRSTMTKITPK